MQENNCDLHFTVNQLEDTMKLTEVDEDVPLTIIELLASLGQLETNDNGGLIAGKSFQINFLILPLSIFLSSRILWRTNLWQSGQRFGGGASVTEPPRNHIFSRGGVQSAALDGGAQFETRSRLDGRSAPAGRAEFVRSDSVDRIEATVEFK